ncbi:MAG: conjugative transposon protein TraM [Flavobacteriaceae bacterium]|nr:conjugative transposon protein TraM [Flavobacteriaceae bacterium]MCY4216980.1 conjugative transposon protein TraM [Flavobacteriaceae bacterium]
MHLLCLSSLLLFSFSSVLAKNRDSLFPTSFSTVNDSIIPVAVKGKHKIRDYERLTMVTTADAIVNGKTVRKGTTVYGNVYFQENRLFVFVTHVARMPYPMEAYDRADLNPGVYVLAQLKKTGLLRRITGTAVAAGAAGAIAAKPSAATVIGGLAGASVADGSMNQDGAGRRADKMPSIKIEDGLEFDLIASAPVEKEEVVEKPVKKAFLEDDYYPATCDEYKKSLLQLANHYDYSTDNRFTGVYDACGYVEDNQTVQNLLESNWKRAKFLMKTYQHIVDKFPTPASVNALCYAIDTVFSEFKKVTNLDQHHVDTIQQHVDVIYLGKSLSQAIKGYEEKEDDIEYAIYIGKLGGQGILSVCNQTQMLGISIEGEELEEAWKRVINMLFENYGYYPEPFDNVFFPIRISDLTNN